MFNQLLSPYPTKNKELIKAIRKNKKITPMRVIQSTSKRKSILFQKEDKTALVIPCRTRKNEHTQIHLDKHFQLVKYIRVKIKWDIDKKYLAQTMRDSKTTSLS